MPSQDVGSKRIDRLPKNNLPKEKMMRGGVMGKTLAEKIWESHIVRSAKGEPDLLYIDLHLIHEVTSPQE